MLWPRALRSSYRNSPFRKKALPAKIVDYQHAVFAFTCRGAL